MIFTHRLRQGGRSAGRRGLTLLELLVVVLILAILTTVAVQSVEPMIQQARFDATRKTLDELQTSLLGSPATASSDGQVSFLDDMGRLPASVEMEATVFQPAELWTQSPPGALPLSAYQVQESVDGKVSLGGGWRGPYLRLPIGQTAILDGWGKPIQMELTNLNSLNVLRLVSLGSDAAIGTTTDAFSQDLVVTIPITAAGMVAGNVHPPTDGTVAMKLYSFDAGQANLAEANPTEAPTTANGYRFEFSNVNPYGRKAIWVETNGHSRVFYFTRPQSDLELRFTTP